MRSDGAPSPALSVLGPVSLHVEGRAVPIGGPLPRRLLGALLVNRDALVSVDRLVEVLWGDDPPETAVASLHTYVSRLRRLLPGPAHLESVAPGYRLVLEAGAVDVDRFEAAVARGLGGLAQDPEGALADLDEALAMWHGDCFAEFRDEWWARAEATRLEELRVQVREARAEAFLALERDEAAVSAARAVTVDQPSRERAWRALLLGLHRCGRQAEALRCAGRYRSHLRDESGLDPSQDFAALEHDIAVDAPHLRSDAPPPALVGRTSDDARRGNLPAAVTSLVGRDQDLKRLMAELDERRLVTLTGTGGVGKTRLATEAAWRVAAEFPDGAWLCELAPVADPDAVAHAVATTLTVRHQEGLTVADSVVDALLGRRALVLLDNCEHVSDAAADLAERITQGCPTVRILATSRAPLGVAGERIWPVPSLPAVVEGVRLFCDRAADADASFAPAPADLEVMATICERLDGLPLAIELAAGRVRSMTLADVADRLDDRFTLLRRGRRGGLARHQTLQATVEWSYQLLADEERMVFDRLAVFAGGFDIAAAQAVCGNDQLGQLDVGDLVMGLVDKSMAVADLSGIHARYRLLETLRQYGERQLTDRGELAAVQDRNLGYFAELANATNQQVKGRAFTEGMAIFEAEWDNLRSALQRAVAVGDAAQATGLVEAVHQFAVWRQRHELGEWAERVISLGDAGPGAYGVAAMFASLRGDHEGAVRLARAGMAAATPATRAGLRLCTEMLGRALWYSAQVEEGWVAAQAWEAMFDPTEEPFDAAWAALCLSTFANVHDPPAAAGHVARARRIAAPLGNPGLATHIEWATGRVETTAGHDDAALGHYQRATELAARTGDLYFEGWTNFSIALHAATTNADNAASALREAMTRLYAARNWMNLWAVTEAVALYWADNGRAEPCAVLLGHLEAHDIRHPGPVRWPFIPKRRDALDTLRDNPGADSWMARGAGLDRYELVAYVLSELDETADETEPSPTSFGSHS